jgi:hypothetical protein
MRPAAPAWIIPIAIAALLCSCASHPAAEIGQGARVRLQTGADASAWQGATIGTVGDCMAAMVGEPPDEPVRMKVIGLNDVTRMQVSSRYDGLRDREGAVRGWAPGADTTGEQWREVALDAVRAKQGNCSPGF